MDRWKRAEDPLKPGRRTVTVQISSQTQPPATAASVAAQLQREPARLAADTLAHADATRLAAAAFRCSTGTQPTLVR